MASFQEKVHIVVGKDVQQGSGLIRWAISKWSNQPATFIILQILVKSKDLINTPIGVLPISSVNEEMLWALRANEQEAAEKDLKKYMALCSQVKVDVMRIERFDEPLDEIIIGLISNLGMKELVMNVTVTKSLVRKNKYDLSVAYSVHKLKPEQCELFVVCGEKLVCFNHEKGCVENEDGVVLGDLRKMSKEKRGLKGLLGKKFTDDVECNNHTGCSTQVSPSSKSLTDPYDEVENYVSYLQTLYNNEGEDQEEEETNTVSSTCQYREGTKENEIESISTLSKQVLETKIKETEKMLEEKRREAKAQAERRSKAEWAISICNQKVADLKTQIGKEKAQQNHLKEELEVVRRHVSEATGDIDHIESELKVVKELEAELKTRLEEFDLENSWFETQLAKAMSEKSEMERRAEALRRKKDAIRQQIEQCKLRELSKLWHKPYRDFTADEIRDATGGFSGDLQIGAGERSTVYRAKICHIDVAVKFSVEFSTATAEKFMAEVDLLSRIRHPNILHVIGACEEQRCVVFEFAAGGSVRDALLSSAAARRPILRWHERIRIASEVASALGFLHASGSAHGRLCASRVLLDRHLSVKLVGLLPCSSSPPPAAADVDALGELVLQLLAGMEAVSAEKDSMGAVDPEAGDWPADIAAEFADVGIRCAGGGGEGRERMAEIARELEDLKQRAEDEKRKRGECEGEKEMLLEPSSACFCPILQEMMEDPRVAADGFSYEHDAIKGWLESGHETSPMTNLKLNNTNLTPNHALRSLISSCKEGRIQ